MSPFGFQHSYAHELPGASQPGRPEPASAPRLLFFNAELAEELGLTEPLHGVDRAQLFAGNQLPPDAEPVAQAYAGHQFGGFAPQLGDGRALLLGELIDRHGRRRDLAFKGSGRTPFSRRGDGKAAVGPMLREALIGEAMHALGIPTTRALAVVATGDPVYRERVLPGAVLTRVAASHLRVGTFQYFAARGQVDTLRRLVDHAIARHDPDLVGAPDRALALLRRVAERQAALVADWIHVGFIHGVMNTDNMTVSGETIDYGPCAFVERYDPQAVFSSIDQSGRYAFGRQAAMARWNLARLGETLLPLIATGEDEAAQQVALVQANAVISDFPILHARALLRGQRRKLGLAEPCGVDAALDAADTELAQAWLSLLHTQAVDHTLAWRRLADAAAGDDAPLQALFPEPAALAPWLVRWRDRLAQDTAVPSGPARAAAMRRASPWLIPRNHRVEEALEAASEQGDLGPFERLLEAVRQPWDETPARAHYAEPAPAAVTACYQTFCGT